MEFKHRNKTFDITGSSQDDHIYKQIVKNNTFYEEDLLDYMYATLRSKNTKKKVLIIDVGANIGNHSVFFRSFLSDYLISIEPNKNILPVLHKNLSKNIDHYTVYECGVGEQEGMATISFPDGADNNIGMAQLSFEGGGDQVKVSTIDTIVDQWKKDNQEDFELSIIKIDVEGMELPVLKGAQETITQYKPHIFAEAATQEEYAKLNSFLQKLGYKKMNRWAATPVYHFAYQPGLLLTFRLYLYKKLYTVKQGMKAA